MEDNVFGRSSASSSWNSLDAWSSIQPQRPIEKPRQYQSADLLDLMGKRNTLQEMMDDFKMNGFDTPYNPDEDGMTSRSGDRIGRGPSGVYLRQKSWPEPEATPEPRLPRPKSEWIQSTTRPKSEWIQSTTRPKSEWIQSTTRPKSEWIQSTTYTQMPKFSDDTDLTTPMKQLDTVTKEQVRVLNSLPNAVLYGLLRDLEQTRNETTRNTRVPDECRFCKNNGERESYYRLHVLKDSSGRVTCPVLRKFVCKRCGASGDYAHTLKYCPLSTDEERIKATAMMRSVRLASGRRRVRAEPSVDYVMFGDATPSFMQDYRSCGPLDPRWADLEQKLSI